MQVLTAWVRVRVRAGELDELVGRRRERAATGDLDLRALGVKLRGERVERDGLEADEVVARGHARGDRRRPGRVLVDHLAGAPVAVGDGAVEQAGLVDLEELERLSVDTSASAAWALGEVRELCREFCLVLSGVVHDLRDTHHRAVRVRPDLVPVGSDWLASADGSGQLESARASVVVAGERGVGRVLDGVAAECRSE